MTRVRRRRYSGRREVVMGFGAYAVYLIGRALVDNERGRSRAARNARRLVAVEERLGLHVEPWVQALLVPRYRRTVAALNVLYVTLNVVMTVGWQARLFFRRHPDFHRIRTATALTIVVPQAIFVPFPSDPPRRLEHLVDTMDEITGVDIDEGLLSKLYNPVSAFPSIHLAFAVVTSEAMIAATRGRLAHALGRAYPPAVAFTVIVTANHYVVDVLAGTALGFGALRAARALYG
jgi:membrane-associated phospholipid phosphatase